MAAILPSGMRAVSTQISPETSAGGFILPNDHVDVILTRRDKDAEKATGSEVHTSETILANVRVLAIDQAVEEKNGQKVVVGKTATLELAPRQAETLALAHQLGTLSLALRSITDASPGKTEIDDKPGARAGVNVVRFGIGTVTTPK
jgi:pilus assembly protein CpaB